MASEIALDNSNPVPQLDTSEPPPGSDRRAFMVRSAMAAAIATLTGRPIAAYAATPATSPQASVKLDPRLDVVKKSKGPVMTLVDEFYKVGPGPSSSHTIGPMRITYDFYQRCTKLPAEQQNQATALKVNLFGSLSATGKGHGTERASLAGLIGMEPATTDPAFLDGLAANPDQTFKVKIGNKEIPVSLKDIIYDATKGEFRHPNTMTCKLLAGDKVLLEQEYYSVGGGFIEWKGYTPPKKNPPKYPYERISQVLEYCKRDNISLAQLARANETAISGKTDAEIDAFLDKILGPWTPR
jgi:L-serine dehydratase